MQIGRKYLVDTDILIDVLHDQEPSVKFINRLFTVNQGEIYTTDVTVAEIYAGTPPNQVSRSEDLLRAFSFMPINYQAARQAGVYVYTWGRKGIKLSTMDALLAGLAKTENLVLVTRNKKHFPMADIEIISP